MIGATWVLAYLSILIPDNVIVTSIYVILNSLQGVFIFFAFGFTSRVRKLWKTKVKELTTKTKSTGTSSGGKHKAVAGDKNGSKEELHMHSPNKQTGYINNTKL